MVPYNFLFIYFIFDCAGSLLGFPGGSDDKASACNAGDLGLIPGQEDPLEKDLCCWVDFSPVVENGGYSLAVVQGFLIAVYSLNAEHRLYGAQASAVAACGLGSCSSCALEHRLNSCGA